MTLRELEGWIEAGIGALLLGAIIGLIWQLGEIKEVPQKIEGTVVEKRVQEAVIKDEIREHNGHRIPVVVVYPRRWELVLDKGICLVDREAWNAASVGAVVDCGAINGEGE